MKKKCAGAYTVSEFICRLVPETNGMSAFADMRANGQQTGDNGATGTKSPEN